MNEKDSSRLKLSQSVIGVVIVLLVYSTMSGRPKRSLSPLATIPPEDCTRDTFDQHANLSDRQFLCWALQTEARVRFAKLEGRDDARAQDTTLNSEYLIDLYPFTGETKDDKGKLARERHAFARKSIPYLQSIRDPDMSFEALTRLEIDRPQSTQLKNDDSKEKKANNFKRYLRIYSSLRSFWRRTWDTECQRFIPKIRLNQEQQSWVVLSLPLLPPGETKTLLMSFEMLKINLEEALKSDDTGEISE